MVIANLTVMGRELVEHIKGSTLLLMAISTGRAISFNSTKAYFL